MVAAIALTALAFLATRRGRHAAPPAAAGQPILPDLPLADVVGLRIAAPGTEAIELRQGDGAWTVASRFGHPADFSRIADLVRSLAEIKVVQEVAVGSAQLPRLALAPPDAPEGAGCRVELLGADGNPLATFVAGKLHMKKGDTEETAGREWPNGRYLLIPDGRGGERAVLVAETLDPLRGGADDWLDKAFPAVSELRAARLERNGQAEWALSRGSRTTDFVAEAIPEGFAAVAKAKADAIGRALAYLRPASVADPATPDPESGLDQAAVFIAESFDGLRYTLRLGSEKDGQRFLRIAVASVDLPAPAIPEDADDAARATLTKEHADKVAEATRKAQEEQARFSPWLYLFPKQAVEAMLTPAADLFEKPAESGMVEVLPKAGMPGQPHGADQTDPTDGSAAE
jgi:hypothetical protein